MKTIGVVGAGVMGAGIAQTAAHQGEFRVKLCDIEDRFLERGLQTIRKGLGRLVEKEVLSPAGLEGVMARISTSTDLAVLKDADLIIEAVSENFEIKKEILQNLEKVVNEDAVLASNTSTFPITQLAGCTTIPDRVVGMHWFNPAPVMQLVEVIRGLKTSDSTVEKVRDLAQTMGKSPIEVGDSAGFVVNRVQVPMVNEAVYLLSEGVASAEAIDEALKLGAAHPMGPLALADLIGLDVCLHIMETLHQDLGDDKYRPCPLLRRYVQAGKLGRKSKQGFFSY